MLNIQLRPLKAHAHDPGKDMLKDSPPLKANWSSPGLSKKSIPHFRGVYRPKSPVNTVE